MENRPNWKAEIHRILTANKDELDRIDAGPALEEAILYTVETGVDNIIQFLETVPHVDLKTNEVPTKEFIDAWRAGYLEGLKGAVAVLKQFKQNE